MLHKAAWMGQPMRIELTRADLFVYLANHYITRGAPNERKSGINAWRKEEEKDEQDDNHAVNFSNRISYFVNI